MAVSVHIPKPEDRRAAASEGSHLCGQAESSFVSEAPVPVTDQDLDKMSPEHLIRLIQQEVVQAVLIQVRMNGVLGLPYPTYQRWRNRCRIGEGEPTGPIVQQNSGSVRLAAIRVLDVHDQPEVEIGIAIVFRIKKMGPERIRSDQGIRQPAICADNPFSASEIRHRIPDIRHNTEYSAAVIAQEIGWGFAPAEVVHPHINIPVSVHIGCA